MHDITRSEHLDTCSHCFILCDYMAHHGSQARVAVFRESVTIGKCLFILFMLSTTTPSLQASQEARELLTDGDHGDHPFSECCRMGLG